MTFNYIPLILWGLIQDGVAEPQLSQECPPCTAGVLLCRQVYMLDAMAGRE